MGFNYYHPCGFRLGNKKKKEKKGKEKKEIHYYRYENYAYDNAKRLRERLNAPLSFSGKGL